MGAQSRRSKPARRMTVLRRAANSTPADGYQDTHESMGAIAKHYNDLGWNVLLPDQRGHGNSEGAYVGSRRARPSTGKV